MSDAEGFTWSPITDLPENLEDLRDPQLPTLMAVWREQSNRMRESESVQRFLRQLRRQHAIETGIVERLYDIDRGITQTLIENGIDASLIPHGATDRPANEVVEIIADHENAIEGVFDLVANRRPLTTSYVKQLHQALTAHQSTCEAVDHLGRRVEVPLLTGDWKRLPNNPERVVTVDGSVTSTWKHEYCPPEHVASEMDKLLAWHQEHLERGVPPEVEAAWLHHRFTQIHPFQDGNGRVARCLATYVFVRHGGFPLVITRDDMQRGGRRTSYIEALEEADRGSLASLARLFARRQRRAFVKALSISEQVIEEHAPVAAILERARETLERRREERQRDYAAVFDRAADLHSAAKEYLEQVAEEVQDVVQQQSNRYNAWVYAADNEDPRAHYHRFQVIEGAKQLDYYANLRDYRSWVVLAIEMEYRTEILVSLHGVGHEFRGLLLASAVSYQRVGRDIGEVRAVCPEPFEITYTEDTAALLPRFRSWLQTAVAAGMESWRADL